MSIAVKLVRWIFYSTAIILASIVMTLMIVSAYWRVRGGEVLAVQTASMVPTFAPGDALVARPVSATKLQVGDIVSYQSQLDKRTVISHRIVAIDKAAHTVTTKGDHLAQPDTPISMTAIRGRDIVLVPKFGYVMSAVHNPVGMTILMYLPAVTLIAYELKLLIRRYRVHYVLAGRIPRHT